MSILKNVNYILELDRIPCAQPDILLIIKTAFQSAPPALLTLFAPGCTDILKLRIGNSPWHLRGIKGLIKGAVKPYPLAEQQFLYKVGYYTAEKYLWWWMVADVTTEFVTTWQSLVYQEQQCQLPGAGTAYGYFAPSVYGPGDTGGLVVTPIQTRTGVTFGLNSIIVAPGFDASIAWTCDWDSWPTRGHRANVTTWMIKDDDPARQQLNSTWDPAVGSTSGTGFHIFHHNPGAILPTVYKFYVENTGDEFAQAVNTSWNVGLTGRKQGNLTWGCTPKPVTWPFPTQ